MIGIGLFLLPKFLSPDLSNSLTDAYELLRCFATLAILKTFGFADFNKKQLTRAYHAQNRPIGLNRCFAAVLLMRRRSFLAQPSEKTCKHVLF